MTEIGAIMLYDKKQAYFNTQITHPLVHNYLKSAGHRRQYPWLEYAEESVHRIQHSLRFRRLHSQGHNFPILLQIGPYFLIHELSLQIEKEESIS